MIRDKDGFTLVETLTVLVVIGILAAISIPTALSAVNKAKEAEAEHMVGAMNRGQEIGFLGRGSFTTDISVLGLGIPTSTKNYDYRIEQDSPESVVNIADPSGFSRAFVGGVEAVATLKDGIVTQSVLCRTKQPTRKKDKLKEGVKKLKCNPPFAPVGQ